MRKAQPKCICCKKEIECAIQDDNPWEAPSEALLFTGTGTFGSTFYDRMMNPEVRIEIIICDECLENNRDVIRWVKTMSVILTDTEIDEAL